MPNHVSPFLLDNGCKSIIVRRGMDRALLFRYALMTAFVALFVVLGGQSAASAERPESFADLKMAMTMIMQSFSYGQSSLFSRLFSPKIDKLLFAATKADHVTPEQHKNLASLFDQLVYQTQHHLNYDVIKMIDRGACFSIFVDEYMSL